MTRSGQAVDGLDGPRDRLAGDVEHTVDVEQDAGHSRHSPRPGAGLPDPCGGLATVCVWLRRTTTSTSTATGITTAAGSLRSLTIALVLNAAYTLVEIIAALLAGSLSLLADAGHNLSDVVALSVAAGAVMLARRPATPNRSFGLRRAEILAALVNAVALIVIALVVFVGAIRRFADPPEVPGGWLIAVASIGLLVNLIGAAAVFRRDGEDLNLRAAYVHLVGDALGSVGVIVTGLVIVTTGWRYADPIAGVLIAVYLVVSSWSVLRESTLVLLEASPRGLDAEAIGRAIAAEPGVVEVHDLHVWQITSGFPSLSAHVLVHEGDDCHAIRRAIERMLDARFGVTHTTLQVDHEHAEALLTISPPARP